MRTTLIKYGIRSLQIILLATAAVGCTSSDSDSSLSIHDAWIREAPPNSRALAGYMVIQNHQKSPVRLMSVSSPMFSSVELHRSVFRDGVASMTRHKQLTIPANDQLKLKPGDYHLMMFNPERPLKEGDQTQATLEFSDGETMTVMLNVIKATQ